MHGLAHTTKQRQVKSIFEEGTEGLCTLKPLLVIPNVAVQYHPSRVRHRLAYKILGLSQSNQKMLTSQQAFRHTRSHKHAEYVGRSSKMGYAPRIALPFTY